MTTRRWLSPVVLAAFLSAVAPVNTWAAGADSASGKTPNQKSLQAAVTRAAAAAAASPSLQLRQAPEKSGVRMQSAGGGHTMMIVTLLSTVVGIGATVYMVKEMQKTTKSITTPSSMIR